MKNYYVSSDPEQAEALNASIATIEAEIKNLQSQHKTASRGDKMKITNKLQTLGAQIFDLKAQMPKQMIVESVAIEHIIESLVKGDTYPKIFANFMENVAVNPTYAVEWSASLFESIPGHERIVAFVKQAEGITTLRELAKVIYRFDQNMRNEIVSGGLSVNSTSHFANAVGLAKFEGLRNFYNHVWERTMWDVIYFLKDMTGKDAYEIKAELEREYIEERRASWTK